MSEILLVNPQPRRKRRTKKRPTRRRTTVRRKNPVRRRTTKRRVTRRRRRNPIIARGSIQRQLKTAGMGAAGAVALDVALTYIPLPAAITGGYVGKITKAAGAIALGVVAHKLGMRADNANRMAEGALTVQLYGLGKELLATVAPGVALSAYVGDDGLGYYGSGWNPSTAIENGSMGSYIPDISADSVGMQQDNLGMHEDPFGW